MKKYQQRYGEFVAEGDKIVQELLTNRPEWVEAIYALPEWMERHHKLINQQCTEKPNEVKESELKKITAFKTPNQVLAIVKRIEHHLNDAELTNHISLVLDNIQDPGNLGAILRIADWFGINNVICSPTCVDCYNHKVVQASMGAFLRVRTNYTDLNAFFEQYKNIPVYGAVLDGVNIFETQFQQEGFILIGNESKGIAESLKPYITQPISIPANGGAESLNASVATGIICAVIQNKS